jgi:flagellar basal body-associated protein FliL
MRGNRSLVIIAVVLIVLALGAGAVYVYLNMLGPAEPTEAELTPPVEIPETTEVVVALQNIPRGMQVSVSDNAIALPIPSPIKTS